MALSAINTGRYPNDTLMVLDEIQDCPKSIFKFFCEDAPDIHIIAAGSLLGISLHSGVSYPVGKVEELRLYPMNLPNSSMPWGKGKLASILKEGNWNVINLLETELISLLRQYYYVGGMPAAVTRPCRAEGTAGPFHPKADYTRLSPRFLGSTHQIEKCLINMVWDSIPAQLAKENKKFIYGAVKKSARAADFELAIQWLIDAGLAYKVQRVNTPRLPFKFYEDLNAFKLFMLDVGLMGRWQRLQQNRCWWAMAFSLNIKVPLQNYMSSPS